MMRLSDNNLYLKLSDLRSNATDGASAQLRCANTPYNI